MRAPSPLLESFEELGALTREYGLYSIKPFKDWKTSSWCTKIFQMRLCNAGELMDVFSYCQNIPDNSKVQAMKIELLIRSVYSVENRPLITVEELKKFNEDNNMSLSTFEFLRMWIKNFEQVVVERLDIIYNALQEKQIRQLKGELMCGHCGQLHKSYPEGSKKTKFMVCELVDKECLEFIDKEIYEFEEEEEEVIKTEPTAVLKVETTPNVEKNTHRKMYKCPQCQRSFQSIETLNDHRIVCDNNEK